MNEIFASLGPAGWGNAGRLSGDACPTGTCLSKKCQFYAGVSMRGSASSLTSQIINFINDKSSFLPWYVANKKNVQGKERKIGDDGPNGVSWCLFLRFIYSWYFFWWPV